MLNSYHKFKYLVPDNIPQTNFAPWDCHVRNKHNTSLDAFGLQRVLHYAKDIYKRNGYPTVNFIEIEDDDQVVDALQLTRFNGFFWILEYNEYDDRYGYAESSGGGFLPSRSERSFVNMGNPKTRERSGESKYYSIGYLLAHENLHHLTRLTYYHYNPRDIKTYKNEGYKNHNNRIPNLNMDGEVLVKQHGGIPTLPPSNPFGTDQKEKIIDDNAFWTFIALDEIFRPQSNN